MAFNSNGQISYLILDRLYEGSKYGLEIIEYITKKTNGGFLMKKPTLYSCLTRMEKKGIVSSSYWGESELGGKRHYYTITDIGRETLKELEATFKNQTISSSIFEAEPDQEDIEESPTVNEESVTQEEEKTEGTTFLEQSNFFDLVKPAENKTTDDEDDDEDAPIANQINFFDMPVVEEKQEETVEQPSFNIFEDNIEEKPEENVGQTSFDFAENKAEETQEESVAPVNDMEENTQEQEKMEYYQSILESTPETPAKDDAVFLDETERFELSKDQEEQNQRIFDSSSELKKYRKKKSFSENQIEMSVVYDNDEDEELQKAKIAALKQSLLNMKNGVVESVEQQSTVEEEKVEQPTFVQPTFIEPQANQYQPSVSPVQEEDEEKDDGIFITDRMTGANVPVQRKIAPPNIDVFHDKLPAPKRNSALEPTYKDMMSKIFERKREKEIEAQQPVQDTKFQSLNNYADLKKYYNSQGIDFKEYQKAPVKKTHNTNLLKFVCSLIMLGLSVIASLATFIPLNMTGNILHATSFMFYTIPLCFLCYCIYTFIIYKTKESKKPTLMYGALVNWIVFGLSSLVVIVVNLLCGMQVENMTQFLTSLILPAAAFLIMFPINYHIQQGIYSRYSK